MSEIKTTGWGSYDPDKINTFRIASEYHHSLSIWVKYQNASNDVAIGLGYGESVDFKIGVDPVTNRTIISDNRDVINQLSLNGSKSADDIDMNGYGHSTNDNMTYNAGDKNAEPIVIMDFYNYEFLLTWNDEDGIDKGGKAIFTQYASDNVIYMKISNE